LNLKSSKERAVLTLSHPNVSYCQVRYYLSVLVRVNPLNLIHMKKGGKWSFSSVIAGFNFFVGDSDLEWSSGAHGQSFGQSGLFCGFWPNTAIAV